MRVREMRELSGDDLKQNIAATRKELVELRFQQAGHKLESPAKLTAARKRLARLLTLETERTRAIQ